MAANEDGLTNVSSNYLNDLPFPYRLKETVRLHKIDHCFSGNDTNLTCRLRTFAGFERYNNLL